MKLSWMRNRWLSHTACVMLGFALAVAVWAGSATWRDLELHRSIEGHWKLSTAHVDPNVIRVDSDFRPDGTFVIWQTRIDHSVRIVEQGRWWVSRGRLMQNYVALDGRPVPFGVQQRPEEKLIVRADRQLFLVWPAGLQIQMDRMEG